MGALMAELSQNRAYTLVVGSGVTGQSVARYLQQRGDDFVIADSRAQPPARAAIERDFPGVELHTGRFNQDLFTAAGRIVLSPGVPLAEPAVRAAVAAGVEVTGDIDLFAAENAIPVIAITGSNGKSTVTALLTTMAQAAGCNAVMGGNIGTPVLDLLEVDAELFVLELSSFQLETLQALPMQASVVLNVVADHMDRYADFAAYVASKNAIYRHTSHAVINLDDDNAHNAVPSGTACTGFTLGVPASDQFGVIEQDGERWLALGDQRLLAVSVMKLRGEHNIANALAALALGYVCQLDMAGMLRGLQDFTGLQHRMQWVANIDGSDWFNDSKATNVGATIAAITGLPGKHVLIAGGESKDADFDDLARVAAAHLRAVVLFGKDASLMQQAIADTVPVFMVSDMAAAVDCAREQAERGDNVLLSPACASFDMFDNFEHRGEVFMQQVQELAA